MDDAKCDKTIVIGNAIPKIFPDLASEDIYSNEPESIADNIVCIEVKAEDEEEAKICYIEVIHNDEECSDKHVILENSYVPRKLFREHDVRIPEVRDSGQCIFFEITDFSVIDDPYASRYRPPVTTLMKLIGDLNVKNSNFSGYGVRLDYGQFDIEGLRAFEGFQLKDDVVQESIWFEQKDYAKPKGSCHLDVSAINEFQEWLLNFGSEDTIPIKGRSSLQTRDIADLACDRWINDALITYFSDLIENHCPRTSIVNFAHVIDVQQEVLSIQCRLSSNIQTSQILFISPVGIHPDSDETFVSQECLVTSHYVFASFLFNDNRVRYADTLGLKIPSEFISKVNLILSYFDIEPTYSYCHDPRGTSIEDEPRFISHTCTRYCSMNYPLQTCTNVCGIAVILGMCISATSRTDFVELFGPESQNSKFAYLKNISHYSHFLRLALMHFMVKSSIDLNIISDADVEITDTNHRKIAFGQINLKRRKNTLNISNVSDLVQDAVLKYAKSKEKPAMLLVCQMKSSGKLVTKSFPCSFLGQDDSDCVSDIQSFINSTSCREWLSSYVCESSPTQGQSDGSGLLRRNASQWSRSLEFHPNGGLGMHEQSPDSDLGFARAGNKFEGDDRDVQPVRHLRRKNKLDISNVSHLICDAKLKFVRIKGKPALQLGCVIKSIGKSVTKSFPCSTLGQDDVECVARIQEFINSIQCTQWLNGYMKVLESPSYDDAKGPKLVYRKNYLDIQNVSHLISDARVRFVKCKGKPYTQLICQLVSNRRFVSKVFPSTAKNRNEADSVAVVQTFLKSSACITWLCNCKSRNVLNIDKVSSLISDAKLKYIKFRGKPMVQLICQLRSTNKLAKKTFPCYSNTFDDPKCVSDVQSYLDSNGCLAWLKRSRSRTPSINLPIDISNISDLVDDARLKFQNINNKPTMQLICRLTSNHKTLSKNFTCSSLGPKDSECIAKIQSFINSIDCLSWLYRFMIKNPGIEISGTDSSSKLFTEASDLPSPADVGGTDRENDSLLSTIKMEQDSPGELSEGWMAPEMEGHDTRIDVRSSEFCLDAYTGPLHLKSPHESEEDIKSEEFKSENLLSGDSQLDLKNVSDLIEDVQLRYVRVDEKLKLCLLCQIKFTNITIRKYFPCTRLNKDPKVMLTRIQAFIDSKKFLKWLSKSISHTSGKSTLDVKNIADLVEYANLKYVGTKGRPVIYLLCRLKATGKLVRKAFPCHVLGKDYVNCIDEIQNFVNSSNCRTWLTIYSGKNASLMLYDIREKVQNIKDLSCISGVSQPEGQIQCKKLNIHNISNLVSDAKVIVIKSKGKQMLQLICNMKSKGIISKCFPYMPGDGEDAKDNDEIQKFVDSEECKEWLHKHHNKVPISAAEWSNGVSREGFVNKEDHMSISLKVSKEYNSIVQNTVPELMNEKELDVDSISHLVYSAKLLFVNIKQKHMIQLLCQLKSTGELVTKNFPCSHLGFEDKDCVSKIQSFVGSTECNQWLCSCNANQGIESEKELSKDLFKSDIVGKPEIVYVKPKTLRLICHLRNGRTKCKAFRCSKEGRNDKAAMKEIDDFLSSAAFGEWLHRGKGRIKSEEEWKFYGYVKTGLDTKLFVDDLTFDVNQRFFLNRKGSYEVLIHRDESCNIETLVENPSWGTTHRLDDTYSLKEATPSGNNTDTSTVAVCLLLSCASKTKECQTDCGKFIKDVNIVDNTLTCCGHVLQDCHCTNCFTYMTPQWCKKKDNTVLCKNCDIYLRAHGTNRPSHLWKESMTANFRHLKCKWKLKLVLRSDNMSRWHIYKSVYNEDSHDRVIQDRKRPSLYTKDEWLSNKIRGQKDSPKLVSHKRRKASRELVSVGSRKANLKENVKNLKMIKISDSIKQETYQVHYSEENVQYLEPYEDYVQDGGVITEEIGNSDDVNYHYDDEETASQPPKKLKIERHGSANETNIDTSDASMVCIKCIQQKAPNVFGCSSMKEMNLHLTECHKEEPFACAACYAKDNVVVTFVDENLFKEHQRMHVTERKT